LHAPKQTLIVKTYLTTNQRMTIKPTGIQSTIEFESIKSEEEDYNSSPLDYRLVNYPTDFTLENLHQQWKSQELIIPPVQNQSQWSKLIESFLLRLPVPEVFVYKERKGTEYILLDGHQRLKSIFSFMDGVFVNKTSSFRLVGLNPESPFSQKSYSDLTETDQRKFNNSLLRAYIIQQLIPDDSSSTFHIFQRLNNGANFLTNQEIRNSICHGNFVQFLAKLNNFLDWRKILGWDDLDKYFHDVELNVRFLAISNLSPCKKPMNEHLSQFMTSIKTFLIRHVCNATKF